MTVTLGGKRSRGVRAVRGLSLCCEGGTTTAVVGPSGCGKSTLLRLILGLVLPDPATADTPKGSVEVGGVAVTPSTLMSIRRRAGYVIQTGGLFPHLTCLNNATLASRRLGMPRSEAESRARELAALTQLPDVNLTRFPSQLSGGQRQRVALVRALMGDPDLLLLDEPLGALDPIVRYELQDELKDLFARLGITVVLVTHDMDEASHFAHKVAVMREGKVLQFDSPEKMRSHPTDQFVEMFFRAGWRRTAQGAGS